MLPLILIGAGFLIVIILLVMFFVMRSK